MNKKPRLIIDRLIEARKAAGLSQAQAAKLLGFATAASISQIETDYRNTTPSLSLFLEMCEIYNISPVWALTGVNPDFDENAFDVLAEGVNASIEDILTLKETLQRLSYGENGSQHD